MEAAQYFDEAMSLFFVLPSYRTDQLLLAGRTIHLNTPSPALRGLFMFSISHLIKPDDNAEADLTIWYAEDKDLPQKLKAPPWDFNPQGYTTETSQDDIQIFFLPWQKQIFLYSRAMRTGIYWVKSAEDVPWWETTFSFRTLFHCWTRDIPAQLVHAGAMANDHTGVLITGPSGSGKSTSCLNLVRKGYKYLGDDYVWIELADNPEVYALYQTAKIEPDNLLERFNDWVPFIKNKDRYKQQKAIFDMKSLSPASLMPSVSLKAILLPVVAKQKDSLFKPTSPSDAFMAMAPTTMHHLPHNRDISYKKMMKLSAALPTYHWRLGYDPEQFNSSFSNFITHELSRR